MRKIESMSDFIIKHATRQGIKPLVGFYGRSGSGKTLSALYFARGLVGPTGKIRMIDSENKRGSIFADIVPGGYDVIDIDPPFSPDRYSEAISIAEEGSDVVVVDSMSHEWSGEGGVLDWAEEELQRMGGGDNNKMRSWIKPKMAHKMMVMRLLRCKCPLICCLRGEEKTHIAKDEHGKSKVITDQFSSPLFDPRFIYEMLINFETVARDGKGGYVIPRKITHPDIANLLPSQDKQIGIEHGKLLAEWCKESASTPKFTQPADPLKQLKSKLWSLCESFRGTEKSWSTAEIQLKKWKIIEDNQTVSALTAEQLEIVIEKVEIQTTSQ